MLDDVQKQEVLTRDEIELLLGAHMVQDQLRISSQEKILQRLFQSAELDGHGRTTIRLRIEMIYFWLDKVKEDGSSLGISIDDVQ